MGIKSGRALAHQALVEKEFNDDKGYLLFKLGIHEVTIIIRPDEAPEIFINGVLCIAQQAGS
jgi:hypothetical protein